MISCIQRKEAARVTAPPAGIVDALALIFSPAPQTVVRVCRTYIRAATCGRAPRCPKVPTGAGACAAHWHAVAFEQYACISARRLDAGQLVQRKIFAFGTRLLCWPALGGKRALLDAAALLQNQII
jgi:hypothetical protein